MSISLQALEAAFSEIESLGYDEITFPVGTTPITMRTLLPEEEHALQRYASEAWSDDEDNSAGETLAFVDRFRVDTIARAIVQVGDQDLRGIEEIPTGETLPTGVAVREKTHVVMRRLVKKWGGPIRFAVFRKYTEMLRKVEEKAEHAVVYEPPDFDTEIQRLEARIEELKQRKAAEEEETYSNPAHSVAAYGEVDRQERKDVLDKVGRKDVLEDAPEPAPEPAPAPASTAPQVEAPAPTQEEPTNPAVFGPAHTMAPRGERQPIIPQAAPAPAQQQAPPQPAAQTSAAPEKAVFDGGSFVAPDDMAVAAAQANAAMFAARQQAGGNPAYPESESVLQAVHDSKRMPPHVAAAHVAAGLQSDEQARQAELRGTTTEGVEVYALGGETMDLTPRQPQPPPPTSSHPGKGTQNPRFRPQGGKR